jgi:exonuclease III
VLYIISDLAFQNEFSLFVNLTNNLSNEKWILTNIYGPSQSDRKAAFLDWFSNIDMHDDADWLIMGDFNFIRKPSDRNRPRGDINDMMLFNDAVTPYFL